MTQRISISEYVQNENHYLKTTEPLQTEIRIPGLPMIPKDS